VTTSEDFGIPPEVLAQARAASREVRPFLDSIRPVMHIIERQRAAMEEMRSSFEEAISMQPPPGTRQALADLVQVQPR
jgi:hypothetical protein